MKQLTTALICLFSLSAYAQDKLALGAHRLKHSIVQVSESYDKKKVRISEEGAVYSSQNKSSNQRKVNSSNQRSFFTLPSIKFISKDDLKSAFIKVIGTNRILELPKDKGINVEIWLDNQGKVKVIEYLSDPDCGLTLEDFERLTAYIKANVIMQVPSNLSTDKLSQSIGQAIRFNRIAIEVSSSK